MSGLYYGSSIPVHRLKSALDYNSNNVNPAPVKIIRALSIYLIALLLLSRGYNRSMAHSPAHPPTMIVTPMPRRSVFRDAAAVAGGVTVGTTMV